jgi:hypothetical protein
MLDQPFPQLNLRNAAGHVMLTDYCVEFFTVLQCCKNPERFSVSCYRSRWIVKLHRTSKLPPVFVCAHRPRVQGFDLSFCSQHLN